MRTELIRPLPELIKEHAERQGDKIAFGDGRRSVDYRGLERRTRRLAGHLGARWLQPGDRAAMYLGNCVEAVESYLALTRASAIGVPLNPLSSDTELAHFLDDSGARVIITDHAHLEQVRRLLPARDHLAVLVTGDTPVPAGTHSYEALAESEPAADARDDLRLDDAAWMLYTSGTTGNPKGVLSTQRSCLWSVAACYAAILGLSESDRMLWPAPLSHSLAHILCVIGVTAVGATARVMPGFDPDEVLTILREEPHTFLVGVPTMYHSLLRSARDGEGAVSGLRVCLTAGASSGSALRTDFESAFGVPLLDGYGSTETCGLIAVNWPDGTRVDGSCGLPVPGLGVRVVDPDTGTDAPTGGEGEVWVSGPSVMVGYHNKPDATAAALTGGWYRTGDLARRDPAGYLTITGRIKELIIRSGENIHPGEIEQVIAALPGVADAAATGRPHEILGEVPVAFVVRGDRDLDPAHILAACRRELAPFKVPEEIYETDSIPRTGSGKAIRHALLERPARLLATGAGHHENLFRVTWTPLPATTAPATTPPTTVAVLGDPTAYEPTTEHTATHPDADALRTALDTGQPAPALVLLCCPPTTGLPDDEAAPRLAHDLTDQLATLLATPALAASHIAVLTRGAVPPAATDDIADLAHAAARGPVRVQQAAHPGRVTLVDTDGDPASTEALTTALAAATGEAELALRTGIALVPRLTAVSSTVRRDGATLNAPRRAVLITGADRPETADIARHIAAAHRVRTLLLVSPRGQADQEAARLGAELTALGARVLFAACDPADRDALTTLLHGLRHPVTAVVHTVDPRPDTSAHTDDPEHTTHRAIAAATHLHELTGRLTAFVLLSTTSPSTPAPGHDTAATAYAHALAQRRRARGLPAVSLVWGRLTTAQRLAAFDAALGADDAHLLALHPDDAAHHTATDPTTPGTAASPAPLTADFGERLSLIAPAARPGFLLDVVAAETAAVYGHDSAAAVDTARSFRDLGLSSANALQLRNRLVAATGLALPVTLVFDHPTPAAVATHLAALIEGHTATTDDTPVAMAPDEPIAIVGMACRLPGGVTSPEDLWDLVAAGGDATTDFPDDRGWDLDGLYDPDPDHPGTSAVRRGGFLPDAAEFDAGFFGISPREALAMDPQQRLLLEVSWEALERAGIDPASLRGSRTGVFTGVMYHDYAARLRSVPDDLEGYVGQGSAGSVASGRVAYALGLEGPAVSVDTACSSSLVALHWAVQALRSGECTLALAGGVAVLSTPGVFVEFSRQRGLAPDGRCKSFSSSADGTAWAEGVGVLLVERLSDARRNGHRVLAVVRGSAVNQDGASNGLTAPSGPSQQRVIRQALANGRVSASEVDVVEAHGTGTRLGDPIEAQALLATYGQEHPAERPLLLGSLKSNIGHTQAAAGAAGVIKMVMAMRAGMVPATLHVDEPTEHVDWSAGAVGLVTEACGWPEVGERPRRAAVSSFGVSGTNAHVVLEQAPLAAEPVVAASSGDGPVPVVLSARGREGLAGQAGRWLAALEGGAVPVGAVGSAALARSVFEHRAVVVAADDGELTAGLAELAGEGTPVGGVAAVSGTVLGAAGRRVFVFPGQGAQWVGMAVELLESSAVFAEVMRECDRLVGELAGWSVLEALGDGGLLGRVDVVQPVLFAVMVGLARVWESWGVVPDGVVGHSQGEIAAACVAGALSLEDAVRVVVLRSRVITGLAGRGEMWSLAASRVWVEELLSEGGWSERVSVATVNGPAAVVVAGDGGALAEVAARCEAEGVRARQVPVDYASHSFHVEEIRDELLGALTGVSPRPLRVPMFSTVEGGWVESDSLTAEYWYRNLREPVGFHEAITALAADGFGTFVECSAHPVLTVAVEDTLAELPDARAVVVGSLRRGEGGLRRMLASAAEAWVRGVEVDWSVFFAGRTYGRVELPTYAFQRRRYWLEDASPVVDASGLGLGSVDHPLLGAGVVLGDGRGGVFTGRLSLGVQGWLGDHVVLGVVLVPGVALVEMVVRAGDEVGCGVVEELVIEAPLVVPERGGVQVQVLVEGGDGSGRRGVSVFSRSDGDERAVWTRHAVGVLAPDEVELVPEGWGGVWPPVGAVAVDVEGFYEGLAGRGYVYGPVFRGLCGVWERGGEVFVEVGLPEGLEGDVGRFGVHPGLFDAVLHVGALGEGVRLPFSWGGVRLFARGAGVLRARLTPVGEDSVSVLAVDVSGRPVLSVESLATRPVDAARLNAATTPPLHHVTWEKAPVAAGAVPVGDWAVLGPDGLDLGVPVHDLLAGVEEAPPEVLLVPVDGGHQGHADSVESVHRAVRATLALLQEWLGNPAYAESRLVILTRGVRDGSDELVGETVAGLVRSAQSEHPDRIVLLDAPSDTALTLPSLRAAVACGEPEVAVEGDQVWVRRLARLHPSETPAEVPLSGSVLVTGGTGGLGRVVARHLVERGAEHVVLVSRSGREAEGAAELESELAGLGARVTLAACDVADRAGLEELIRGIEPPLTGVVHTAGVLDDGTVESLTADQLARVLRPKAEAAWHLHELTRGLDLTLFALYSSAAAVFGNPGQGNYAAANAFLDALARHRRTQGLPALSLAWGLWAESSGMTTGLGETDLGRLSRYGVRAFSNAEGLALLDAALGSGEAAVLAARIDLRAVAAQEQVPALFKTLVPPRRRWAGSGEETRLPLARRLAGMAEEERERFLLDVVLAHTAAVLGLPAGGVDPENPFKSLGFDSLLAVELRNRLSADIAERLPSTLVFDHPTPGKLTAYLRSRLDLTQAEPETPSYEPLLRELDRLESALAAVEEDGPGRAEVARRLRYLAAQVSPADAETSTPFDVDSASADDIFDFLDKEFG